MSAHPLPKTISVQRTLVRMPENAVLETTVIKTLIEPEDDTNPPLYALLIKTTIGPPTQKV